MRSGGILAATLFLGMACDAGPEAPEPPVTTPMGCSVEGREVGCGLALWLTTGPADGATVRERCENVCGALHDDIGGWGLCGDGLTCGSCAYVDAELLCADCSVWPDHPLDDRACDSDPCTEDWCGKSGCFHEPHVWIGNPCERSNDLGTCQGARVCDATVCATPQGDGCFPSNPETCEAPEPSWEVADGLDNDCDGATDEDPGPIVPLTAREGAMSPALARLNTGELAVAWVKDAPSPTPRSLWTRVTTLADPTGGVPQQIAEAVPHGAHPALAALDDGGYALGCLMGKAPNVVVRAVFVGAGGLPRFEPVAVTHAADVRPEAMDLVALPEAGAVVVWSAEPVGEGADSIGFARLDADGAITQKGLVAPVGGIPAVASLPGGAWAAAWVVHGTPDAPSTIHLQPFGADGTATGPARTVSLPGGAPPGIEALDLAPLPDGGLLIAYSARAGGDQDLRVRALDGDGTPRATWRTIGGGAPFLGQLVPVEAGALVVYEEWTDHNSFHGSVHARLVHPDGDPADLFDLTPGCKACRGACGTSGPGAPLAGWIWGPGYDGGDVRVRAVE